LKPHVFFDRFCFDLVSLLGENLTTASLTFTDVEYIMRKLYQSCTHFFLPLPGLNQGSPQVKLLRYDCVETPFTWEAMSAFDIGTINKMLNRPSSPEGQTNSVGVGRSPEPMAASGGELLGNSATAEEGEEAYAELEMP